MALIGSVISSKGTSCPVGERQPLIIRNSTTKEEGQQEQCQQNYTTLSNNNNDNATASTLSSDYKISSLDFERVINQYTIQSIRQKCCPTATLSTVRSNEQQHEQQREEQRFVNNGNNYNYNNYKSSQSIALRWILTIVAGLLTGLTSILLVTCTGYIVQYRARLMHNIVSSSHNHNNDNNEYHSSSASLSTLLLSNKSIIFQLFTWTNLLLATLSCLLCVSWVPSAAGSGIPDVKAYLNGVRSMQRLAYLPLFFVKIVGTVLSVSCLLSVGQEGESTNIHPCIYIKCINASFSLILFFELSQHLIHSFIWFMHRSSYTYWCNNWS